MAEFLFVAILTVGVEIWSILLRELMILTIAI